MSLFELFDFTKSLIERLGYFGVFLGTFLEGIFPPIPSEVVMGFAGFLISEGRFQWVPTIAVALAGNILSVSLIWFIGNKFGREVIVRWGKWVGITEKEIDQGEQLFNRYGYWVVFGCQMIPLARTLIAFPAGILKTNYLKFIIVNSLGAIIWLSVLAYFGYALGSRWDSIEVWFKPYERIGLVLVVIGGLYIGYRWFRHWQKLKNEL